MPFQQPTAQRQQAADSDSRTDDLQLLLAAMDMAAIFLDRDLRIVWCTPKAGELFDVRGTDRGRPIADVAQRIGAADLSEDARRVLANLESVEREIRREDGRWRLARLLPYRTPEDRIDGVVITAADITDRKRAEQELADAKEYAESIVETLHEPVLVLHPDLTVRSVNPAFYEHFRVREEETLGRRIYELGNGQWDIPELRKLLEDVLPTSKVFNNYEVIHEFEGIGRRVMLLNARRLDHVQFVLLGIRDITEGKRADDALRASEARLQGALDIATVGVIFWDPEVRIREANDAFLRMSGFSRAEAINRTWRELTPPEFHAVSERAVETLRTTGQVPPYEKQYYRKDGSRWWGLFAGRILGGEETVEFVLDITEQKEAEEALRASEERYRTLFESIEQGFCIIEVLFDESGERAVDCRFLEVNPAFAHHTGLPNAAGRRIREFAPDLEARWFEIYGRVARTGESVRFEQEASELGRFFDVYAARVGAPEQRRVAVLFDDIADRKQHEEQMRFLMAELNHRVKNTLAVVESVAEQTLRHTPDPQAFRTAFGERLRSLGKANHLLTRTDWDGAGLHDVVMSELALRVQTPAQLEVSGPQLMLKPKAALAVHMIIHELSTNAVKYGALASTSGRINAAWELLDVAGGGRSELLFRWVESGGPEVRPPTRSGFGTKVLSRSVEYEFGGETQIEYEPSGVRCTIRIPWDEQVGFLAG